MSASGPSGPLVYYFELSHFWAQLLPKHIDSGKLVNATSPTIIAGSF